MDEPDDLLSLWANRGGYRLCPECFRAIPAHSQERYCINDGSWLLEACPLCKAPITSPYARFCASCGVGFASLAQASRKKSR
ncbi:zinc ribbon domain-containing protein [uncultured Meiothermus sp.]|uniref:zinc ribbon domain-containing protein n=1 Tax=uncultured Meiothermus sp. TaxID=157471 RepID=UPI003456E1FA